MGGVFSEDKYNVSLDNSPVHRAAKYGDIAELEKLVVNELYDINDCASCSITPLYLACFVGQTKSVEWC